MYSNIYLRYLQVITSYINDKIKFSCEQYMYQYCLLATFGLCVDVWMVYMVEEWSGGLGDHYSVYHLSCQNSAYGTICLLTAAIQLIPSLQLIPQYTTKPSLSPTARIPLTISKPHAPHLPFTPSKPF